MFLHSNIGQMHHDLMIFFFVHKFNVHFVYFVCASVIENCVISYIHSNVLCANAHIYLAFQINKHRDETSLSCHSDSSMGWQRRKGD